MVSRRKAAAMAFYLDPNSEILSTMKKQEIENKGKADLVEFIRPFNSR